MSITNDGGQALRRLVRNLLCRLCDDSRPAFPPLPSLRAGKLRAGVYSGEMEISTPLKAGVRDSGSIERGTRTLHSG